MSLRHIEVEVVEVILNRANKSSDSAVQKYLKYNLIGGFKTSPLAELRLSAFAFIAFIALAIPIGFGSGLIGAAVVKAKLFLFLPFTLLIFPSLLEEAFFRGLLIPRNTRDRGLRQVLFYSLLSSLLFVAWHPLNALTINPGAREIFLNPWFLLIAFFLGLSCSLGYIYSRSLWVPVLMHWWTVLVWVLLLGGRNLLLE
jgi:predicted Abi (CAAX) family protease